MKKNSIMLEKNDEILVPVVRFIPLSEVTQEDERIEFAKTSENIALLERLARDNSTKVKTALLKNQKAYVSTIYNILSKDPDEEVQESVKKYSKGILKYLNGYIGYCYFVFSEIPDFARKEVRQAFHSFIFLLITRDKKVNYEKLEVSYKLGLNPICQYLDEVIDFLCVVKNVVPQEIEKIVTECNFSIIHYERNLIEKLVEWMKSTCPANISYIRWISILGEVYLKMNILVENLNTEDIRNKDILKNASYEYIKNARKSEFLHEKDIKLAIEAIVNDSTFYEQFLRGRFYEEESLIEPQG